MILSLRPIPLVAALLMAVTIPAGATVRRNLAPSGSSAPYTLVVLPALGGDLTVAFGENDRGWAVGQGSLSGSAPSHAALWTLKPRRTVDLGTLGGPSSYASNVDDRGVVVGNSDTTTVDPYDEDFCGIGSAQLCQAFQTKGSGLVALPLLPGGNNNVADASNDAGQIVGAAETGALDPDCTPPQILDYEAVVWGPGKNAIRVLTPLTSYPVAEAYDINEAGDVTGASGTCIPPGTSSGLDHAVMWRHNKPIALVGLGGSVDNAGHKLNQLGVIVGTESTSKNKALRAVLWNKPSAVVDLGTLPGDVHSEGWGLNDAGQATGESCTKHFKSCRAFLWQSGTMTDLNTLIAPNSNYSLFQGEAVSDSGNICGFGFDVSTGALIAFVLVPTGEPLVSRRSSAPIPMPAAIRARVFQREDRRFYSTSPGE